MTTHGLNFDAPNLVGDPSIPIRTIRIRREVLAALRLLGRGLILETKDLGRVVRSELTGSEFEGGLEPKDGEISNCARHFAFDSSGDEMVLIWRNEGGGKLAAFWLNPESTFEDIDAVLDAYDRRLRAYALSKPVTDRGPRTRILDRETRGIIHFETPETEPVRDSVAAGTCYERVAKGPDSEDVPTKPLAGALLDVAYEPPEDRGWASAPSARAELERLEEERIGTAKTGIDALPPFGAGTRTKHDPKLVADFVEFVETSTVPRSTRLAWLSEFVSIPTDGVTADIATMYRSRRPPARTVGPSTATMSDVARYFANFSPWEKNNVLFRLADFAKDQLRGRAADWACVAEPKREKVKK